MSDDRPDDALDVVRRLGVVRPADLVPYGISRGKLHWLVREGLVDRCERGVYVAADHQPSAHHTLAIVAKRVPDAVVCLLTALQFHGLTTQHPWEVWVALSPKARKPRLDYPRLRVVRFSGAALTEGVEKHVVENVDLHVTTPAKTVVDCFKYRNKIGVDVAVEALRDFQRSHRGGADELARCARICRMSRVMRPYLDSIA